MMQDNLPELTLFHLNNTRIKQVHKMKYLDLTIQMCRRESCRWPGNSQEIKEHLATVSVTLSVSRAR